MTISQATTDPSTLKKAILRAADVLGLTQQLPQVLGVDEHSWAQLTANERSLMPNTDEWANAVRFAGLFRSLLTLVGTVPNATDWLNQPHRTLGASPRSLLLSPAGLERVVRYLDSVQKYEIRLPPRSDRS